MQTDDILIDFIFNMAAKWPLAYNGCSLNDYVNILEYGLPDGASP